MGLEVFAWLIHANSSDRTCSICSPGSDGTFFGRMTDAQIQAAADCLWDHWNRVGRMTQLPDSIRPQSREAGYAVQARLNRRSAFPLFGWKIAATSKAGQTHLGV